RGPSSTSSEPKATGDNTIGAQHTDRKIGNVHRAALALAIARGAAKEFGHHFLDISALGNAMAVAAVRTGNIIGRLEVRTNGHSHGFLTNVGMQGPHDFALAGLVFRLLLKQADAPHASINLFESVC